MRDLSPLLTKYHAGDALTDEELATLLQEVTTLCDATAKFGPVAYTLYMYANTVRVTLQGFARSRRDRVKRPATTPLSITRKGRDEGGEE